jgi:hypothetical protein
MSQEAQQKQKVALYRYWHLTIAGLGCAALGLEQLLRALWFLWRSGSWSTMYSDPLFMDLAHSKNETVYVTTPSQALSGPNLLLSTFFILLGVTLLLRALREKRASCKG